MKLIFVAAIVCLIFIPDTTYGALPNCPGLGPCPGEVNAVCIAAHQPCICNSGYHLNANNNGCDLDIQAGAECQTEGNAAECVDHATCSDVSDVGEAESLQCTCDTGYHDDSAGKCLTGMGTTCMATASTECVEGASCQNTASEGQDENLQCVCSEGWHQKTTESGTVICEKDIELGEACPTVDSETECEENAVCVDVAAGEAVTLQCKCKTGFYESSEGTCVAEKQLGEACPTEDSETECEDHAVCKNAAGEAETLQCTCKAGYHESQDNCVADITPGEVCQTIGDSAECVAHATCSDVSAQGEAESLQCTCDAGYHDDSAGMCRTGSGTACMAVSSAECVEGASCQNIANEGETENLQCVCSEGWHQKTTESGTVICEADIELGQTCPTEDSETECEENAVCKNVAAQGETETLQCKCKAGYHESQTNCVADMTPGEACTQKDSATECVAHATCSDVSADGEAESLQCMCDAGYHDDSAGMCRAGSGTACTATFSEECVDGASCQNTASEGEAQNLQCVCSEGWHQKSTQSTTVICEEDFAAGEACSAQGSNECVDNAACENSPPGAESTDLKCTCMEHYHQAADDSGKQICAKDTCQDTVAKCTDAGVTTCDEIKTFVGCVLNGVCQEDDEDQLDEYSSALQDRTENLPADCAVTEDTTCTEKVTACFISHLKGELACPSVMTLNSCLGDTDTKASCTQGDDDDVLKRAQAYADHFKANLSCVCLTEISECKATQKAVLDNSDSTDDQNCNAVKELFTCAMTDKCDDSKAIEERAVRSTWSEALEASTDHDCKDSISAEGSTTCALQLTRCALIYGQDKNSTDKAAQCRVAEEFGTCLADDTTQCTMEDSVRMSRFVDEYKTISDTCQCENRLHECWQPIESVDESDSDSDVCPKLKTYSLCLADAICDLIDPDGNAQGSFNNYLKLKDDFSCTLSEDDTCETSVAICFDQFMTDVTKDGVSATDICDYTTSAWQCVAASPCSEDVQADINLVEGFRNASTFRLNHLSCEESSCLGTHQKVLQCKATYDTEWDAATNNQKKCDAMNNMVRCLIGQRCNHYLHHLIDDKYDLLKHQKENVDACELLPLVENGAVSIHATVVTALTCVLAGILVLAQL